MTTPTYTPTAHDDEVLIWDAETDEPYTQDDQIEQYDDIDVTLDQDTEPVRGGDAVYDTFSPK